MVHSKRKLLASRYGTYLVYETCGFVLSICSASQGRGAYRCYLNDIGCYLLGGHNLRFFKSPEAKSQQ